MIRRAAAVFVVLLCGALPAAPAWADQRSEALIEDFVAWVDSSPDWSASVGDVRSRGRDTIAEGLVLSRADTGTSIKIDTLRIKDLNGRDDGGFTATGIWLDGAAIAAKNLDYVIPSAKVESVTMPGMQGLSFDPRHMMTFIAQAYSALANAQFSNLSIPEVHGTSKKIVAETGDVTSADFQYRDIAVAGLADGIVGRTAVGPISIRVSGPGGIFDLTVQSATSDHTDLGALAHVFNPAEYQDGHGDRIWKPILSSLNYSGISGSGPDGLSFKLDEIALEKLDGRQLDKPFTDIWDKLLDLTTPQDSKTDISIDLLGSYAAWRLGALNLRGLRFDAPTKSVAVSLDDLSLSGISADGVDKLTLSGLSGRNADTFLKLGSLDLSGFVAPNMEGLIAFAALEKNVDPQMHAETIMKTFAALPRLDHLGLSNAAAGKDQGDAVALDSLSLDFRNWNDIFAGTTELSVSGVKVPPHLLGPSIADLVKRLNYNDLVLGLSLSDRWSPDTGTDNADWQLTLRDGGNLNFSYALTGLTKDWLVKATAAAADAKDSKAAMNAMLDELRLEHAAVSVTDKSLLERAFTFAADAQKLDVDGQTYMKQMRAAFPFLISAALPPTLSKLLSKPVQDFLAGGQQLVAEIVPASPLSMAEFLTAADDPMALPKFLNLQLDTKAPAQ